MKHIRTMIIPGGIWIAALLLFGCGSYPAPRSDAEPAPSHSPLAEPDDPSPGPAVFRDLTPISPDSELSLAAERADWYKDAVFYHIWINAFNDSTGDGIGDIPGITARLDYLAELGVNGIWLSPFFESASTEINLHMYDTIDHYRVDPRFGTNEDLDELLHEAHARGIRVIFDWVPNHVSDQHPWFLESAAGENNHDDWFIWRDEPGSQEGPWGQTVWHRHTNGSRYYGVFWSGMPDINYRHQAAKDAITDVAVYWLNRGFDGLRVDAIKYLYEDERSIRGGYEDEEETFEYFQGFREQILDAYSNQSNNGEEDDEGHRYHKFMVAENWTRSQDSLEGYMVDSGGQSGFHMTLDFPFAYAVSNRIPIQLSNHWKWVTDGLHPEAWMATFLSNHDNVVPRPISLHGEPLVRAAAAAQLLGPGTPFVYYGNEIGMEDAERFAGGGHADRRHRQPFEWDKAEAQMDDPDSLLHHHRKLAELRHSRVSLRRGDYTMLSTSDRTLIFLRSRDEETTLAAINLGDTAVEIDLELPDGFTDSQRIFTDRSENLHAENGRLTGSLDAAATAVWSLE